MPNIYHYTQIETFNKMLGEYNSNNPNICFWATHYKFTNDPTEYNFGGYALIRNLPKIEEELNIPIYQRFSELLIKCPELFNFLLEYNKNKPFVELIADAPMTIQEASYLISFSENRDSIPMWGMYGGNGSGISLGFCKEKLFCAEKMIQDDASCDFIQCLYCDEKNESVMFPIEEYMICKDLYIKLTNPKVIQSLSLLYGVDDYTKHPLYYKVILTIISEMFFLIGSKTKHKEYYYEREWRLSISNHETKAINYRDNSHGTKVPYVSVYIPFCALDEIIIGPTNDFNASKKQLINQLKALGIEFDSNKIIRSAAPYRTNH